MRITKHFLTAGILILLVLFFMIGTGIADVIRRGAGFLFIPSFTPVPSETAAASPSPTNTDHPTCIASPSPTDAPTLTVSPSETAVPTSVPTETQAPTILPTIDETALVSRIYQEVEKTIAAVFLDLTPTITPTIPENFLSTGLHMVNPTDGKDLVYIEHRNQRFWIDWNEVTNAEYRACADAGYCSAPASEGLEKITNYYSSADYSDYPVVNVSFDQAVSYCQWAEMTLMSLQEWQIAADLAILWDEELILDQVTNGPVGFDSRSHIFGNVWEWTRNVNSAGSVLIAGGSWKTSLRDAQMRRTGTVSRFYTADDLGFRCSRPIQ